MEYYSNSDELYHYGVLGMKWGMRRFQNKDGTLTKAGKKHLEKTGEKGFVYKSHSTKKYTRKLAKAQAKGKDDKAHKYELRLNRSKKLDQREQDYARKVNAGVNIATRLTTMRVGGKPYMMHQAMNGKTRTLGSKIGSGVLAVIGGRPVAMIRKAVYLRSDERSEKARAKIQAKNK